MASYGSIGRSIRSRVSGWLKRLRIKRETAETPDAASTPRLMTEGGIESLGGLSQELAEEFADDLRLLIDRQLIAWVPLSPSYRLYKHRMGMDPRILIATGRYVHAIQAIQGPDGSWSVGIPPEPLRPGSRYTLKDLAKWLEFGTQTMPPRPHWRPARQIWRTKLYRMKKRVQFDLAQELKKRGWT